MANPQDDGSYKLTGTKIFITGGEQDLSDNIILLVLARTPGAPKGIKGISLFLVPKIIPNDDGSYNITGTKIFITCGEHDLSENVVHLVLARTPKAPEGI